MNNKLKIYACSGVDDIGRWLPGFTTEGTNAVDNTQAMNRLLALINDSAADCSLADITPEEYKTALQNLDIYAACFHFARMYREYPEKLTEAGYALNQCIVEGLFNTEKDTAEAHSETLDKVIARVESMMDEGEIKPVDTEFTQWFKKDILAANIVGLPEQKRIAVKQAFKKIPPESLKKIRKSSGWENDDNINVYLNDGGKYFIYTYFTDAQIRKLPSVFRRKQKKQQETYEYVKNCFVPIYGEEKDMRLIIAASIKQYFHTTPEQLADDIAEGRRDPISGGVGDFGISAIISLIAAIASALAVIIKAILQGCASIAAEKYTAPSDPSGGIANGGDFEDWNPGGSSILDNKILIAGGVVAALLFLLKK